MSVATRRFNALSIASLLTLIALCLAWELWLAPLRPGGSMLVLKMLPLLAPVFGLLKARRYTHQWVSMLSLLYLAEGVVRAYAESGITVWLAGSEVILSISLFTGSVAFVRASRESDLAENRTPAPGARSGSIP